jgi:hypothetical protein
MQLQSAKSSSTKYSSVLCYAALFCTSFLTDDTVHSIETPTLPISFTDQSNLFPIDEGNDFSSKVGGTS